MPPLSAHLLNIIVHVAAGVIAMGLGFFILATEKGTAGHRKAGRNFACLALVVCGCAVIGSAFFNFVPMFAVLTVLTTYQLLGGWHAIYTRDKGPNRWDLLLTVCAALWGGWLLRLVLSAPADQSTTNMVSFSSLGALAVLIVYDSARWFFPRRWHARLWEYEHIYKLVSSLFAMLSAFAGNVLRFGQPYTQVAPSLIGIATIAWFFGQRYRKQAALPLAAQTLPGEAGGMT